MDLIILGVDGVDPELLEKAREERDLPGWERLHEEAFFSELPSSIPSVTIPAWICMFSGYDPGKFGAYHLTFPDFEEWEIDFERSSFPGINFWDRMEGSAALHNVPGTSPVYEINGYMKGGFPSPKHYDFYPEELEEEMEDIGLEWNSPGEKSTTSGKFDVEMGNYRKERQIADRLMEKDVDVFVSVIKMTDSASHWAEEEDHVFETYEEADRAVQKALDKAEEENANLLVVSDHGFKHFSRKFNITKFLEDRDMVDLEEGSKGSLAYRLAEPVLHTRLKKFLKPIHNLYANFFGERLDAKAGDLYSGIRKSSKVLPCHIGLGRDALLKVHTEDMPHGKVSEEEKEEILEKLENDLEELEHNGEKVVEEVWRHDEIYTENDGGPDLILRTREDLIAETVPASKLFTRTNTFTHALNGIFYAKGPDIDISAEEELDIYDVAPLIYTLLREPLPDDLEGELPENLVPELEAEEKSTEVDEIDI